jgi:hypothetical protein
MNDLPEQEIRNRVYRLWQAAGEPLGQMDGSGTRPKKSRLPSDKNRAKCRLA